MEARKHSDNSDQKEPECFSHEPQETKVKGCPLTWKEP